MAQPRGDVDSRELLVVINIRFFIALFCPLNTYTYMYLANLIRVYGMNIRKPTT